MAVSRGKLKAALIKAEGELPAAAKILNMSRSGVWRRVKADPTLQALIDEIQEETGDIAESNVRRAVRLESEKKSIDPKTSKWLLERKFKDRGYGGTSGVRLDDDQLSAVIERFGNDPDALRKLAGG